ncbi:NAD(P)-binding protein [Collybia nuda]|uniref:NAD(P)-binding protein n=1 Tax=Collybia nuda TaxID=64659 RepID=A0A9P6CDC0_9AGAR|nr:NAD(P)-binding protein [Collybia nuda]
MPPIPNRRVLFNEIPPADGYPIPGKTTVYDTSAEIDLENAPLSKDSILVKVICLSLDPYMRSRMRKPDVPGYVPPFILHEPISGHGVSVVLRSRNPHFKEGAHVRGFMDFAEYCIIEGDGFPMQSLILLKNDLQLPWSLYVGILGVPGRTAVFGWREYVKPKARGVAFITTGAGAVGSLVIQLAKRDGMKVIASAGTDDKVNFMNELGADVAFNYHTNSTKDILREHGPLDVYWDNVGGEVLDLALENAAFSASFVECGMITTYNSTNAYPFKNMFNIISKNIQINGFLTRTLLEKHEEEFLQIIPKMVGDGELKYREDITSGLANTGSALLDLLTGKNTGKSIVIVNEGNSIGRFPKSVM